MRNIKLTIAYDGTNYHGFQRQPNGITIQQVLEEKLAVLVGHAVKVAASGRTDAGVHALGQVVSFKTNGTIPAERIPKALGGLLPKDIVVLQAEEVDASFHARFSAVSKIYVYKIYNQPLPDPFLRNYSWHVAKPLDAAAMAQAAEVIVGTHDFSAFRASGGATIDPVRTIMKAQCARHNSIIELEFWGTGFLYHMVRNLAGTLVDVGLRRITAYDFKRIRDSGDRRLAGITAPPQGLYLKTVLY